MVQRILGVRQDVLEKRPQGESDGQRPFKKQIFAWTLLERSQLASMQGTMA